MTVDAAVVGGGVSPVKLKRSLRYWDLVLYGLHGRSRQWVVLGACTGARLRESRP
jgi:hypothetical protein